MRFFHKFRMASKIKKYYVVPVSLLCLSAYVYFTNPSAMSNMVEVPRDYADGSSELEALPRGAGQPEDYHADYADFGNDNVKVTEKKPIEKQHTTIPPKDGLAKTLKITGKLTTAVTKPVISVKADPKPTDNREVSEPKTANNETIDSVPSIIGVTADMNELLQKIKNTDRVNGILYQPPVEPPTNWAFNLTKCPKNALSDPILMKRSLQHLIDLDQNLNLAINGTAPVNKYMSSYRNPCWVERLPNKNFSYPPSFIRDKLWQNGDPRVREEHSKLEQTFRGREAGGPGWRTRCLPHVYMAGIYKAGTTDFYFNLVKHPMFALTPPKEPFFWRYLNDHLRTDLNEKLTFQGWLDTYDIPAEVIRQKTDAPDSHQMIALDASTWTWRGHRGWRDHPWNQKTQKQCITLPQHLKYLTPTAKIIFLLRNPVSWMKSCYNHFQNAMWGKRFPTSQQDLHEKIVKGIEWFNQCMKNTNDPHHCVHIDYAGVYDCHAKFTLYYISVKNWVDAFGLANVMVIPSESYYEDPLGTLQGVLKFLKLPPYPEVIMNDILNKKSIATEHHGVLIPALLNSTATLLREFTKPWNKKLADLLHDDRFLWES